MFGDQLGPHFVEDTTDRVLLIESRAVFRRRAFHRQKAHLVLSAMRHRAAELGIGAAMSRPRPIARRWPSGELSVCHPTSWAALHFVPVAATEVERLPARGFVQQDRVRGLGGRRGRRRLLMEDFYRDARGRLGMLMDGAEPVGGRWNFDAENREPPPKGADRSDVR